MVAPELLALPNFLLTPHVAWSSRPAMQALADQLIDNIEAFMAGGEPLSSGDFIGNWLSLLRPAFANVEKKGDFAQRRRALEQATIELSLTNLMSFPWVARLVERGELHLHGAYFGVGDGVLTVRSEDGEFRRLVR